LGQIGRLRQWGTSQVSSPLFWILCAAAGLRIVGLTWGLPASDGWDSDGIAPRDFLVGVIKTYQPGEYFTYPPLQLIALTLLTSPGWIVALFKAHSLSPPDLISELIQPSYMTFFALVARVVSAAMSVATIFWIGKIGEELGGRRLGICTAAACALNATLTYYGHVTNLDGPSMFWSTLAAWQWIRAIARHEPRRFFWACLFSVAAIATKDQSYAVFLLSVPLTLTLWLIADPWPRQNWRQVVAPLIFGVAMSSLLLLAVDGAITNPHGFRDRLLFLLGPASQDNENYQHDWSGWLRLLRDATDSFRRAYPMAAAYLGAFGLIAHVLRWRMGPASWVAGFFPLFAIVSFTLTFNFVALRPDDRFVLAQTVFFSVYLGIAIDVLAFASRPAIRWVARAAVLPLAGFAHFACGAVDAAFIYDPRYDAERWMHDHVRSGEKIETYGLNVYLPRFPRGAEVTRVAPTPNRNPLPGVTEIKQPFGAIEARKPRFIVVSAFWVGRYLIPEGMHQNDGHVYSAIQRAQINETDARQYFRSLRDEKLSYRLVHRSEYSAGIWPPARFHQSTAEPIWIFERVERENRPGVN
jgi:hypothetical protein